MSAPLLLRIVPPVVRTARRPHRMIERQMMCYRNTWPILVSGFFEPLFYLLSIRVGLSKLVGDISVGGAAFPDHGSSPATLMRAADEALYMAKGKGRDQWHIAAT